MTDVAERVRRGVRLLDRVQPGWERQIDLERLDLGDSCDCVLGQVYGGFTYGLETIDGEAAQMPEVYGFDTGDGYDPKSDYPSLTERWRGFIRRRLARRAA